MPSGLDIPIIARYKGRSKPFDTGMDARECLAPEDGKMDRKGLQETVRIILDPEPDEDGFLPREWPHPRIADFHELDISYTRGAFHPEGSTLSPDMRLCGEGEVRLRSLCRNMDVPVKLFHAGLRLYGESMIAYHGKRRRRGDIRYYPPIIMTFWSGFETYVRYSSELMLITVKDIPQPVVDYLLEQEVYLDDRGKQCDRSKWQPVLRRYVVLLRYGYDFEVDRGNKHWQLLLGAKDLRDYYTHLDVHEPRAVSSQEVLDYMEAVMMALIWPSCELGRTLLLGIYRLYEMWAGLAELETEYIEQPSFKDVLWKEAYLFHCNFENVDTLRFRNVKEELRRREKGG